MIHPYKEAGEPNWFVVCEGAPAIVGPFPTEEEAVHYAQWTSSQMCSKTHRAVYCDGIV